MLTIASTAVVPSWQLRQVSELAPGCVTGCVIDAVFSRS